MRNKSKTKMQMYSKKQKTQETQKYFRKLKVQDAGITLIALVVTIIILLILAGVSLATFTSNNGIFKKAKDAAELYEKAEADEQKQLGKIEEKLKKYTNGSTNESGIKLKVIANSHLITDKTPIIFSIERNKE